MLFYGFATYGNAGWMREQVCKYMCPYARFQSAMFDKDTLVITYDAKRGEPPRQGARPAATASIAASACRCARPASTSATGLQYECIGCAACIDGCNQVMDKVGKPQKLIRYSTLNALEGTAHAGPAPARARLLAHSACDCVAAAASLYLRTPLKVDVIRDRAAIAREVEGGLIENVYRLQIMNTTEQARAFQSRCAACPISTSGASPRSACRQRPAAWCRSRCARACGARHASDRIRSPRARRRGVAVREHSVFIVR